eukprot:TRINITY_DN8616_c0_g1_i1.p1 TRINITY_DN8616_c0_g1~~TRINITY_DN8616_c0_g1_i1.p1  ORF type:complete len:159 (-),score=33.30 TRINITY_DN8616_c0_g1_i1:49-525(-)
MSINRRDIVGQVRDAASSLRRAHPSKDIIVTGHSLGAALSTLAALDIKESLGESSTVWNYGDPRVGNDVFAEYWTQQVGGAWRTVNRADIVPHLPPQAFGFHHIPTEIWFRDSFTDYTVCNGSGEDPDCSDSLFALSIPDHLSYLGFEFVLGLPHGCY